MRDDTDESMGLAELEARSGCTARTIRFYTTRGLLPAPRRLGRVAVYGPGHLARLELIRTLQSTGLSLQAIGDYMQLLPGDASEEAIALHGALLAPWTVDSAETLDAATLDERAGRSLDSTDRALLERLRIIEPAADGGWRVHTSNLEGGMALIDAGLPPAAALAARKLIDSHVTQIAEGLTDIFRSHIWPRYRSGDLDREAMLRIAGTFQPLTVSALVAALSDAVDVTKRKTVEQRRGLNQSDSGP
ncbi:MerR family transcriptional regulator [Corynebacterium sp. TAE3-ERU12]|uniref:MerR family transcriptional regulator n=1 Tax=Corynebacterium sp. TAE3-ERU12 TaxID=2849491 RepID=UPI001C46C632|nr:MerR family transcriptional regulator [Corynebacterium sp. TAE3-ERU12]MBV7295679.1 MerR family transcriptional regulator [Corynebacterium sp. TAE3-ERU12]